MEEVTNLSPGHNLKRALVLDLDGTVRRNKNGKSFIDKLDDIELMPGMEDAIRKYRKAGYFIIAASNQGGVAHGHKIPLEIEAQLDRMISLFVHGNPFHIIKCCFHMPDGKIEPYRHRSLLRKPYIGMLAIAEMEAYNHMVVIDWDKSLFVGDQPEDEQCAKNADVPFKYVDKFLSEPIEIII